MSAPHHILLTGANGFLGQALTPFLQAMGHTVTPLIRSTTPLPHQRWWNPTHALLQPHHLEGITAVIHLAGPSINARWTSSFKAHQLHQRTQAVKALAGAYATRAAQNLPNPTTTIIASGLGAYGPTSAPATETTPYGTGFLAEIAQTVEGAAAPLASHTRLVIPRFGMVLAAGGGALQPLLLPHRLGLGGPIGSGQQIWGWVSRPDVFAALTHCLTHTGLSGPVNVVAPQHTTQRQFSQALANHLHRPAFMPLPAFVLKLMFGEMASLLLTSSAATPTKLTATGFTFAHPTLAQAFTHLIP